MVETMDSLVFQGSSGPPDKIEPHMHIGETDFMALQQSEWDDQICYLNIVPLQKGPFGRPPECPSPCRDIADALTNGHPDCMCYWHTKPLTPLDPPYNVSYNVMPQWHQSYCTQAARWPSPEVLMYMRNVRGLSWYDDTCAAAAAAGSLACLSYSHCSGAPWDASVCSMAAAVGSMECLVYAHEHGCKWNWETCAAALQHGHVDCLQYVHLHGEAWCKEEELLQHKERFQYWELDGMLDGRARCLLYMHCCGGCKLPYLRGTVVGERVLKLAQERRAAVLLSFRAAGRARAGSRVADAAHAAMAMVPGDLVRQIICNAKLLITDWVCSSAKS